MEKIKIVFMGTPDFSVPVLEGLIENYSVVAVVCQPDKKVGRKQVITFSPVKEVALRHHIPVLQPQKIRCKYEEILSYQPDMIITCAYGQIIPKELLDFPVYGCVNVHASLLPKLRGGAPIHHALIDGLKETGITIMYMNEKMDEGDILFQKRTSITDDDDLGTLTTRLSLLGKEALLEVLPQIIRGERTRLPQDEKEASYAYNITHEEEKIDFRKTALEVFNQIRGLSPSPGAYTQLFGKTLKIYVSEIGDEKEENARPGEIVAILKEGIVVACLDKNIVIKEVKLEGKKKMPVRDFLNGIDKEKLLNLILE